MRWLRVNGVTERLTDDEPDVYDWIESQYEMYERMRGSKTANDKSLKPELEPTDDDYVRCVGCGTLVPWSDAKWPTCGGRLCRLRVRDLRNAYERVLQREGKEERLQRKKYIEMLKEQAREERRQEIEDENREYCCG